MAKYIVFILALLLAVATAAAEEQDSLRIDTLESVVILPCDTCPHPDTVLAGDTLTEAQQALARFEQRRQKVRDSLYEYKAPLSVFDTLTTHMFSSRLNSRQEVDRSYYHDAGDYLRFDPSYFVTDYDVAPMRKTVAPFGLAGNRMNVLSQSRPVEPFEHALEPDGLVDFNDFATALDNDVFVLPGPAGAVLGGRQGVATLMTLPKRPDSYTPESAFLVDKGSGYSFARGRYAKRFTSGREIDMSIGYRNTDGLVLGQGDEAYHYVGRIAMPFGTKWEVSAAGRLYAREAPLWLRPLNGGSSVGRERIDREVEVTVARCNDERTRKYELSYSHLRQASRLHDEYDGNFNNTGHGVGLAREWTNGSAVARAEVGGDYLQYDNGYSKHERVSADAFLTYAWYRSSVKFAFRAGQRWVEDYDFLPSVSAMLSRESEQSMFMLSAGYVERVPTLHELFLPYQEASVYGYTSIDYADGGNESLQPERQVIGGAVMELGRPDNAWRLSVTGGKIFDGIDWQYRMLNGGAGPLEFLPGNGDLTFVSPTLTKKLRIADFLRFHGGASYYHVDYDVFEDRAYSPEYQLFSGAELHLYWSQKLIHLYAYGEVAYSGPYHGYVQDDLGEQPVVNVKLSFQARSFRFHFVIQNALLVDYAARDYFNSGGRFSYFGFTWDFLD